jgi:hypothetical protein
VVPPEFRMMNLLVSWLSPSLSETEAEKVTSSFPMTGALLALYWQDPPGLVALPEGRFGGSL